MRRHSIPAGRRERKRQGRRVPSISFFSNLVEGLHVLFYLMREDEAALQRRQAAVRCGADLQELTVPKPNKRAACKCYT